MAQSVVSTGGGAAAAPAMAREEQPTRRYVSIWVSVALLLAVIVGAASYRPIFPGAQQNQSVLPQVRVYRAKFEKAITIPALNYTYSTFTLPDGSSNVGLQGHFAATGGTGNDVEVFLLNEDGFANWKSGHAVGTLYNSGRVTQDSPNVVLPNTAGTYYLVFNNKFSLLSPKAVEANLTFSYNHL